MLTLIFSLLEIGAIQSRRKKSVPIKRYFANRSNENLNEDAEINVRENNQCDSSSDNDCSIVDKSIAESASELIITAENVDESDKPKIMMKFMVNRTSYMYICCFIAV